MKKREPQVVISFHTTAEAMAMEQVAKRAALPGRLIPVPREMSAGCGIAFCVSLEEKDRLLQLVEEKQIEIEQLMER